MHAADVRRGGPDVEPPAPTTAGSAAGPGATPAPVVDPGAAATTQAAGRLGAEGSAASTRYDLAEDDAMMAGFRAEFRALLDGRVDRIADQLERGDLFGAETSLRSLESTSLMAQATALGALARKIRLDLPRADRVQLAVSLRALAEEARRVGQQND